MTDTCPHAVSAGSYLLEMLSPEETAEFRRHCTRCLHCQREIVALMPGALFLQELRNDIRAAARRLCTNPLTTLTMRDPWWASHCGTFR